MQVANYSSRKASLRGTTKLAFQYLDLESEPEKLSSGYSSKMEEPPSSSLVLRAMEMQAKLRAQQSGSAFIKVWNVLLAFWLNCSYLSWQKLVLLDVA